GLSAQRSRRTTSSRRSTPSSAPISPIGPIGASASSTTCTAPVWTHSRRPSMALLRHGALQPNSWRFVGDDAAIPADEPVTVSLKRWQVEGETLRGRNAPVGVRLKNSEQALALGEDVHRLSLI